MSHIGWPDLPKLVARLKLVGVQLNNSQHLTRIHGCRASGSLVKRFSSLVDSIDPTSQLANLDSYLGSVWSTVEQFSSNDLSALTQPRFGTELQKALCATNCQSCGAQTKCNGTYNTRSQDNDNLKEHGHCISLLSQVYDVANSLSSNLYQKYVPKIIVQPLVLETAKLFPNEVAKLKRGIDAHTYEENLSKMRSVRLALDVIGFGITDYYSSLYIIFHECFVHGQCGLSLNSNDTDLSDRFHDGWMDEVAFMLLNKEFSNSAFLLPGGINKNHHGSEFQRLTRTLHENRIDYQCKSPLDMAATYAIGAQAARRLRMICIAWSGCESQGEDLFYRFSLSVNASTASDQERLELVNKVNEIYEVQSEADDFIETVFKFDGSLAQFSRDSDASILMHSISNIH
jgi:hypothetical protein